MLLHEIHLKLTLSGSFAGKEEKKKNNINAEYIERGEAYMVG